MRPWPECGATGRCPNACTTSAPLPDRCPECSARRVAHRPFRHEKSTDTALWYDSGMTMPAAKPRYTVEEYLRMEESAVDRHEFHDGEILAMSGGTHEHSLINVNVTSALKNRLRGGPCRVAESNLRVRIGTLSKYVYPDASVICGPPAFDPAFLAPALKAG